MVFFSIMFRFHSRFEIMMGVLRVGGGGGDDDDENTKEGMGVFCVPVVSFFFFPPPPFPRVCYKLSFFNQRLFSRIKHSLPTPVPSYHTSLGQNTSGRGISSFPLPTAPDLFLAGNS